MADTTETMATALADCLALQVEQLQTLAERHNPREGVDLSEALACTIEMQGAIRRMLADLIHGPAPAEEFTPQALSPPTPPPIRAVNEDYPSDWGVLMRFFKRRFFKK